MIDSNPGLIVVDVRELTEYCSETATPPGHIPGALNYPWNSEVLQDRYNELPANADILVYCGMSIRSPQAADFLCTRGYTSVYNMSPGLTSWPYQTVGCVDTDGDRINDDIDNCPTVYNLPQSDSDGDHVGDSCDTCTDTDDDGYGNAGFPVNTCTLDNCQYAYNALQDDEDGDGMGDVCDTCTDTDGDAYGNPGFPENTCTVDNCPELASSNQADGDGDCIGDVCDQYHDEYDPSVPDNYPQQGNGIGDACDCEGNFNCDADVDSSDAAAFKNDYGRSNLQDPCTSTLACNGDFNCDKD
jgi:rhodanese-related sulfurtransferase